MLEVIRSRSLNCSITIPEFTPAVALSIDKKYQSGYHSISVKL